MKTKSLQRVPSKLLGTCLLVAGIAGTDAIATEVYRWKDANGGYHFSDSRAAAQGASATIIDAPNQRPNPELDQYRKAVHANLAALEAEREQAAKQQATQKIIEAGVQQNCSQLRNAMRAEEKVAVLYTFDNQGDIQYLDDQQRSEYKASLNQQWQHYCD
jgi:dihydroorotase-like cyclic amidohydrolase